MLTLTSLSVFSPGWFLYQRGWHDQRLLTIDQMPSHHIWWRCWRDLLDPFDSQVKKMIDPLQFTFQPNLGVDDAIICVLQRAWGSPDFSSAFKKAVANDSVEWSGRNHLLLYFKTSEIMIDFIRKRMSVWPQSIYGQGHREHREDELALFPKEAETIQSAQEMLEIFLSLCCGKCTLLWPAGWAASEYCIWTLYTAYYIKWLGRIALWLSANSHRKIPKY